MTEALPDQSKSNDELTNCQKQLDDILHLVAHIRHEINNPLTGVLGQAQLLLREELSDRARKRVQTIEELSLRIRDIVAQLREVQRNTADGAGRNLVTKSEE